MVVRIIALTVVLGLSGVAYGQSDTARPVPRAAARPPASDSARPRDDTVDVLRSGAILRGMDATKRRRMIDTLEAQPAA